MKAIFVLSLLLLLIVSCNKPAQEKEYQFADIELDHCADTNINGHAIRVCFDSVYDSRCPLNFECFWQGEATVKLFLQAGEQQHTFRLSTLNAPPLYRNDTILSGYRIKLLSVSPYPGSSVNTPYRVGLSITK